MGKRLVGLGVAVAVVGGLNVIPMNNLAYAKGDQSNNGNQYGWTESNGNHYGLIKQGKILQEQTVTYTAADVMTGKITIQENQTVIFENYVIKLNADTYLVTKNGVEIASGSASDSTFTLTYDPAGSWIVLAIVNNTTGSWTPIPLLLATAVNDFTSGNGLLLGVTSYGDLCYFNGFYIHSDKSQNIVTITKDGTVIEEDQYPSIDNVMLLNSWQTGKVGLYINDNLVYSFN